MNAKKLDTPVRDISPALQTTPAPLSTHWIPLHELIDHWTATDTLLVPTPVGPVLAAIGHALLALAAETSALRLVTRAWEQRERAPRGAAGSLEQAAHCLDRAACDWGRAAGHLERLSPIDLEPEASERARRLSQVARSQQARLWMLTNEVRADAEAWRQRARHERAQAGARVEGGEG